MLVLLLLPFKVIEVYESLLAVPLYGLLIGCGLWSLVVVLWLAVG